MLAAAPRPALHQTRVSTNSAASSRNVSQNDSDTYRVARARPTRRKQPKPDQACERPPRELVRDPAAGHEVGAPHLPMRGTNPEGLALKPGQRGRARCRSGFSRHFSVGCDPFARHRRQLEDSGVIHTAPLRTIADSRTASSSRTFPRHGYCSITRSACRVTPRTDSW